MMISCLSPELNSKYFFFLFLEQNGKRVVLLPGESRAFQRAHASVGLDAQSTVQDFWHHPGLLDELPEGQAELGVSQPLSAQTPLDRCRQRTCSPHTVQTEEDLSWHWSCFPFPE